MALKVYVGNLSYGTTEDALKALFEQFGEVVSVAIIKDKFTEQSKGFGFVELGSEDAVQNAIESLNGQDFEGRKLRVNMAEDKPRGDRPRRNFNNGGDRGYNRGSNNYGRREY